MTSSRSARAARSARVNAILGPAAAVALLAFGVEAGKLALPLTRELLAWSMVPGILSALAFALLVSERSRSRPTLLSFRHALAQMPTSFRRYLFGVGVFGAGDFAHTFLILAATQLLTPRLGLGKATAWAGSFYVLHNVIYAASAYPVGALADRWRNHRRLLGFGSAISVSVPVILMGCFGRGWTSLPVLAAAFSMALGALTMLVARPSPQEATPPTASGDSPRRVHLLLRGGPGQDFLGHSHGVLMLNR